MTPQRWTEVRRALAEALELDTEARAIFVRRLSVTDPELHGHVESLLACEKDADLLLPADASAVPIAEEMPVAPSRVGPWRILREAGRGGMGVVYEAERSDGQYTRRVAVKVLPGGFAGGTLMRRFLSEREILARLEHPGIARMFDGGVTPSGQPYLVMEYVDGQPLDLYARQVSLSVTARLRLFLDVCRAVSYAHSKLVVHRDLKPGNIFVTPDGKVRLLDFGLARMLEPGASPEVTQTAFRLMTPAYASPEQIRGATFGVSGDVFSLGVILYELLAGERPFAAKSTSAAEVERAVCEQNPAPIARRDVPADLKTIVFKALEKDPEQRYPSVEALAFDITCFLEGRPVSARRLSWTYRTAKFMRRNRLPVLGAATATALIVAFAVIAVLQAQRAQRRFDDVRELANSVVFELHDEIARLPGSTKARELVVRRGLEYLDRLSNETGNDPAVLRQLAAGYLRLGDALGKPDQPNLGDRAGAASTYRKALVILDRLHQRDTQDLAINEEVVRVLHDLAFVDQPAAASAFARRALELSRAEAAAHPGGIRAESDLAASLFTLGQTDARERRYPQSMSEYGLALDLYRELDRRNRTSDSSTNVALCLKRLGALSLVSQDLPAALAYYEQARAIDAPLAGSNPRDHTAGMSLSYDLSDLGTTLLKMNRLAEAEEAYGQATALRREAHRADPNDIRASTALASILLREGNLQLETGRLDGAEKSLQEARRLLQDRSEESPEYGQIEFRLAQVYERRGQFREAVAHHRAALEFFETARTHRPLMPNEQAMYTELAANQGPSSGK